MDGINQQSEQPAKAEEHIDVLVVGGGPVGQFYHRDTIVTQS